MKHERLNLSGDPVGLAQELRELIPAPEAVAEQVTEIIARVRASGDDALRFYTREYDTGGTTPAALRVPEAELDTAEARLDETVRDGLRLAIDNVTKVAEAGLASEQSVAFDGHEVRLREVPVDSAAVYVPGGRAPYPSTVIMGVVTARVAGVQDIAVCAPPGADGEVNSTVLGACRLAGASVEDSTGRSSTARKCSSTNVTCPCWRLARRAMRRSRSWVGAGASVEVGVVALASQS